MSDSRPPNGFEPPDEDVDTGEPVAELRELGVPPKRGFRDRIRRTIDRRVLASEVVDFSWTSPIEVFLQFLAMLFEGFGIGRRSGGNPDGR